MSAIFAQRLIRPLTTLDVTWWRVHSALKSQHTGDWCGQSWNMVVQFMIPKYNSSRLTREGAEKGS